jgi:hypothetical protein
MEHARGERREALSCAVDQAGSAVANQLPSI